MLQSKFYSSGIGILILALLFAFTPAENIDHHGDMTLFEQITESEDHAAFTELLSDSGMDTHIHHEGPFTVLAPNDDAFEKLDEETFNAIFNDLEMTQSVLQNHVFQGEHEAEDIEHFIEGEVVEEIEASNGVVLVVNTVVEEIQQ